jgi:dTMP kinase
MKEMGRAGAPRGRLITIEGVEGGGKSTQVARLRAWLESQGVSVVVTSEPDGTLLGLRLRRLLGEVDPLDPLAECLLFVAARAEHTRRVVCPALERGATVLCDRYADSTVAYQGHGRGVALDLVAELNRVATDGLVPDLTIVLDLDAGEGLRRARGRGAALGMAGEVEVDPFEGRGVEFHERVRKGYWAIQAREPRRVVLVDAARSADAVAADIRALVVARLRLGGGG